MGYPSMYLSVPDEWGFCFTQAFQSIGLGLATAIGAALAQPDRLPVAALGDGGGLMGVAELDTVVRLGLPMVVVVYNDDAYGAEVHHFGPHGHRLDTVEFPPTDIAAIARGFGFEAVTVRTPADLGPVADWVDGDRRAPLLIDAKITRDVLVAGGGVRRRTSAGRSRRCGRGSRLDRGERGVDLGDVASIRVEVTARPLDQVLVSASALTVVPYLGKVVSLGQLGRSVDT